ncbi:hypothetical protein NMS06_003325 [Vibrio cholerae]|nr:hypothetical protein [Vibrio cholerae]EJL6441972.1 hypothetical protein [Vibrio cholerae]
MDSILDGLEKMFFKLEVVSASTHDNSVLIFSFGCMIIGLLAVVVDCCAYYTLSRSPLELKHGVKTIVYLFAWSIGAFVIGLLGQFLKIFVVSLAACVFVGLAWPVMFAKMVEKANKQKMASDPEPEQTVGG